MKNESKTFDLHGELGLFKFKTWVVYSQNSHLSPPK